ncbi:MAG: hypothetical protein QNJ97_02170 [Myxococcota bacterium]|nr:hypothetical protein [Myxococcota bacterium]
MKKSRYVLFIVLVAFGVYALCCGDDDDDAACTPEDVQACGDEYADCLNGCDMTESDCMTDCVNALCNCFEDNGCDIPDEYDCG